MRQKRLVDFIDDKTKWVTPPQRKFLVSDNCYKLGESDSNEEIITNSTDDKVSLPVRPSTRSNIEVNKVEIIT